MNVQVRKQKNQIDLVSGDIRDVQKAINNVGGNLKLTETRADELVYSAASDNKDPAYVSAYRHLSTLRSNFEELISVVSDVGKMETDIGNTETRNDQVQSLTLSLLSSLV